jgi:hypothetical protein
MNLIKSNISNIETRPPMFLKQLVSQKINITHSNHSQIAQGCCKLNKDILLSPIFVDIPHIDVIQGIQFEDITNDKMLFKISSFELFMIRPKFGTMYELPNSILEGHNDIKITIKTIRSPKLNDKIFNQKYGKKLDLLLKKLDFIDDIEKIIYQYISFPIFTLKVYAGCRYSYSYFDTNSISGYSDPEIFHISPGQCEVVMEKESFFNKLKGVCFYFSQNKYDTNFLDILKEICIIDDEKNEIKYDRSMCLLSNDLFYKNKLQENVYSLILPVKTIKIKYNEVEDIYYSIRITFHGMKYKTLLYCSLQF